MSLGRLLTAGKSLVGLSSASRYQLRTGTLPKFESSRNPFAPKPQEESAEQETESEKLNPAEMAAAHLKKTQRLPLLPPNPETNGESLQPARPGVEIQMPPKGGTPNLSSSPEPCAPPEPIPLPRSAAEREGENSLTKVAAPVSGWLKKLNPLVWFESRKPAEPKTAIPRFNKAPVQGELSLDNIKVMRNDLNDADVEVVLKKALSMETIALSGQASAAAMAIPELPPARSAWEFLGERLLRKE